MSFRISTNKYLKENDLRVPEPVVPVKKEEKKEENSDSLEALFDFSERLKTSSSKPSTLIQRNDQQASKNQNSFSIKNQKRGMEDFL